MSSVGDVMQAMDRRYPPRAAEPWDRVGLVLGERTAPVRRILLAVDITDEVVQQAAQLSADMVVAHHPLLLRGIHGVDSSHPKGRVLLAAMGADVSLFAAHTNADKPVDGVSDALARTLDLDDIRPLEADLEPGLDTLVVFVPSKDLNPLVDVLCRAGAGAVGNYDRCHFHSPGTGCFRPLAGAEPHIGDVGRQSEVAESRIEMVLPRSARGAVLAALLEAHPYETPAFSLLPQADQPSDSGLGRIGSLPHPMRAAELAAHVAGRLPATAGGVRLAGDPDRLVSTLALLAGAGDSHLDAARRSGADAYLTSDLRHHPAQEAIAHEGSPVLLDVAHWAAEWTWLPVLAPLLSADLPDVDIIISEICTDPWVLAPGTGFRRH